MHNKNVQRGVGLVCFVSIIFLCAEAVPATFYVDPTATLSQETGGIEEPYRNWDTVNISQGNTYLQKRGTVAYEGVRLIGVRNVTIGAYGHGSDPIFDGNGTRMYGIRAVSVRGVTIRDLRFRNYRESCISLVGSSGYVVARIECSNAKYGVSITEGKYRGTGIVRNSRIHDVSGDGIGAWNLERGAEISFNEIYRFGNDGIDVLGSTESLIRGNKVYLSIDHPEQGPRGLSHTGIKAGGNIGIGGGKNMVVDNEVFQVKHYGIWNREATYNVYRKNICYENGVNYNFVASSKPSFPTIEGNVSQSATYEAGQRYDVFMPPPSDVKAATENRWVNGIVNIKNHGLYKDIDSYRAAMYPHESGSSFD